MQKSKIATLSAGSRDVLDWEPMENADFWMIHRKKERGRGGNLNGYPRGR